MRKFDIFHRTKLAADQTKTNMHFFHLPRHKIDFINFTSFHHSRNKLSFFSHLSERFFYLIWAYTCFSVTLENWL